MFVNINLSVEINGEYKDFWLEANYQNSTKVDGVEYL